jgi:hypothetical protein
LDDIRLSKVKGFLKKENREQVMEILCQGRSKQVPAKGRLLSEPIS